MLEFQKNHKYSLGKHFMISKSKNMFNNNIFSDVYIRKIGALPIFGFRKTHKRWFRHISCHCKIRKYATQIYFRNLKSGNIC